MNRETRDKFVSGTDQADLTRGNGCWETPPRVYSELNSQFRFDMDLTADTQRTLCSVWFGSGGRYPDALTASWADNGRVGYSNPPYGPFIQKLLPKAKEEAKRGFTSVLLLPLRVTRAFRAHILTGAARLLFCDARLTFFENGVPRLNEKQFQKGKLVGDPAVFDRSSWSISPACI